jgi:hypothetical protein
MNTVHDWQLRYFAAEHTKFGATYTSIVPTRHSDRYPFLDHYISILSVIVGLIHPVPHAIALQTKSLVPSKTFFTSDYLFFAQCVVLVL